MPTTEIEVVGEGKYAFRCEICRKRARSKSPAARYCTKECRNKANRANKNRNKKALRKMPFAVHHDPALNHHLEAIRMLKGQ